MHKLAMTASALLIAGVAGAAESYKSPDGNFSIDALEALGRVTAPAVSPDGKTVMFGIAYENLAENNSNNDLYLLSLTEKAQLPYASPTPLRAKTRLCGLPVANV